MDSRVLFDKECAKGAPIILLFVCWRDDSGVFEARLFSRTNNKLIFGFGDDCKRCDAIGLGLWMPVDTIAGVLAFWLFLVVLVGLVVVSSVIRGLREYHIPRPSAQELRGIDPSCAICFEDMTMGWSRKLPCSHVFHGDCIVAWTQRQQVSAQANKCGWVFLFVG